MRVGRLLLLSGCASGRRPLLLAAVPLCKGLLFAGKQLGRQQVRRRVCYQVKEGRGDCSEAVFGVDVGHALKKLLFMSFMFLIRAVALLELRVYQCAFGAPCISFALDSIGRWWPSFSNKFQSSPMKRTLLSCCESQFYA